jgi:protein-tyrosine phosphatase
VRVESDAAPFQLLVVCTGNVCRSPAAERLLARALGPSVLVHSAGTHALAGEPMTAPMARLVEEAGCATGGFRARQLTEGYVRSADLVLTATRDHRSAVVELLPSAVRRTFTLRELARLLTGAELSGLPAGTVAERLAAALPQAVAQRGRVQASAEDDAVVDPFRAPAHVYAHSFSSIQVAVAAIADAVGSRDSTDHGVDPGRHPALRR